MILLALFLLQQPLFHSHCASCHGEEALGGAQGPGLAANRRVAEQSVEQLQAFIQRGNPANGMPAFADLPAADLTALAKYVRGLNANTILGPPPAARKITWGPPRDGDWLTYNGNDSGNRYSPNNQITTANVSALKLKWVFPIDYFGLEVTPLESDGVMYVTGPNQVLALDALSGEMLWHFSRPKTAGQIGDASLGTNRGAAILRDKVFFVTDNAHLLGLDRATGQVEWETSLPPDSKQPYGGTMTPLVVDDTVVAGVVFEASSPRTNPKTARLCGGTGPCPKNRRAWVAPRGLPVRTMPPPTRFTGRRGIRIRTATTATAPATFFTRTACWL
jgi:hypothetical protein